MNKTKIFESDNLFFFKINPIQSIIIPIYQDSFGIVEIVIKFGRLKTNG